MIRDMPKPRLPHLHRETNRHGDPVWYYRKAGGKRVRIRGVYDSPEFRSAYFAAASGVDPKPKAAKPRTLRWALDKYRQSSEWKGMANATRRQKENIFKRIIAVSGDEALSNIDMESIKLGRERRQDTPHSANVFLKAMRSFFKWAIGEELVTVNPTLGVTMLKGENDDVGFHTWTQAEMDKFEAHWATGTRERLAYDLLLYTGLRRGDAVRVGKQHVREGIIEIRAEKTGEELFLPILPPLWTSLETTQTGDLAFLCNAYGEPWVKESFGNWFRDVCREAGVPGSAHGLRKAGATRAAENEATDRGLMALFGWTKEKTASTYTRSADRRRLAIATAQRLLKRDVNETALTLYPVREACKISQQHQMDNF